MSARPRSYPTPRDHHSALFSPNAEEWTAALCANRDVFLDSAHRNWSDRTWGELRAAVRNEICRQLSGLQEDDRPWIVGGHQPEFFHPGVWFKNACVNRLAHVASGTPLHVSIDHDEIGTTHWLLPDQQHHGWTTRAVSLSSAANQQPWEEVPAETELLTAACRAAMAARQHDSSPPLLDGCHEVLRDDARPGLAARSVAARHQMERAYGIDNAELMFSVLAQGETFRWMTSRILVDLLRFVGVYNQALADYRTRHRLRHLARPMPNLLHDVDWLETPFWAYRAGARRRERLWAKTATPGPQLRAGGEIFAFGDRDWKIRPRAILTTLFLRLFVGDIFVHGTGGARYDEVTDFVITNYLGWPPPQFLVAAATVWLPLHSTLRAPTWNMSRWRSAWWRFQHEPERWLPAKASRALSQLAAVKRVVISQAKHLPPHQHAERRRAFLEIQRLTAELRAGLAHEEAALQQIQRDLLADDREQRVTHGREWPWLLYPQHSLPDALRLMAQPIG